MFVPSARIKRVKIFRENVDAEKEGMLAKRNLSVQVLYRGTGTRERRDEKMSTLFSFRLPTLRSSLVS